MQVLRFLSQYYEIYVFTSATKDYANKIMDILDPEKTIINGALHRSHCLLTKTGFYVKDLRVVTNRNLNDMIIVDNLSHSFAFQIDNGIPILPWYDDPKDCELKYLAQYLCRIVKYKDIRVANRRYFRLSELAEKR